MKIAVQKIFKLSKSILIVASYFFIHAFLLKKNNLKKCEFCNRVIRGLHNFREWAIFA